MALMDSIHGIAVHLKALVTSLCFRGILWEAFLYPDEQFKVSLKISVLNCGYTSNMHGNTENVNSYGSCRLSTVTQCSGLFGWDNGASSAHFGSRRCCTCFPASQGKCLDAVTNYEQLALPLEG